MTAGLWLFLFRVVSAFFQRPPEPVRDPELLLQQAQQEMREMQAKNRERAVQAITQKNQLQAELDKTQKVVDNLRTRAKAATDQGNEDAAQQLRTEADAYRETLTRIGEALERAVKTTELIKAAIQGEEQQIRRKAAEAMAAKAEWRQAQISASIETLAEPEPRPGQSDRRKLAGVLAQMERTRDVLWQEADAAVTRGDYSVAIRLLTEQQNLEQAIVFAQRHR